MLNAQKYIRMAKIAGLDLGTNSIGWAVVETEDNKTFELVDKGVRIFQEGVKIEKGVESSKAAERTAFRSARRSKYRRKLRKIETLNVLSQFGYCPELSAKWINDWRYKKVYPNNEAFRNWQKTDEKTDKNPYYFRALAVEQKMDLTQEKNRFLLGRAFYHMAQRRGFLSNRLESTKESDGAVTKGIDEINKARGEKSLGQYFYGLYRKGEKIRCRYTHREQHYFDEFKQICNFQELPDEFVQKLEKAIFYQRPLKSQKGLVGNCPFEKNKPRCPVSHPLFEEYRMLAFINNIKIKTPCDDKLRVISPEEKEIILPLFYRKSKEHFNFEEIAKKLTPKGWPYKYFKDRDKTENDYLFNFWMKTSVSGCRTIAQLKDVFGDDWQHGITKTYKLNQQKTGKKSAEEMVNDIWHVLFTFDKTDKLIEFAKNRLDLDGELALKFSKISLKQDYASLSLKAIKKILPYLQEGLIYSHAVFMANLEDLIPADIWGNEGNRQLIRDEILKIIQTQNREKQLADIVNGIIKINREQQATWGDNEYWVATLKKDIENKLISYFGKNKWGAFPDEKKNQLEEEVFQRIKKQMQNNRGKSEFLKTRPIDERVKTFITDNFELRPESLEKLYHPSAVEVYKDARQADDGNYYLGSPMISSVRNPMAMRALHQLRKVVNELIKEGTIDRDTKINIEMARDLKNANERIAWQRWQRDRHNEHERIKEQIKKDYKGATGKEIEPTEAEILKYQLWEEQNHVCLYTGKHIGVSAFIGENPTFDIEHTIPRSLSFDNSQVNLTLCESSYNRQVKRNKIPSELSNHDEIVARLEHWHDRIEELKKSIAKARISSRTAADKQAKDNAIQRRHKLEIELDYRKQKYNRFLMKDVPDGFKNSQLVDTGIITKYARLYMKTVFNNVYTVKGNTVADFRKIWGIQDEYEKKERVNHIHHCIDAITIACMSKDNYEALAKFYHGWEGFDRAEINEKPRFEKPWPTFTEDVKTVVDEVLVSHYTPDNLPKQTKKKLRVRGKVQVNKKGETIYQKGDSVRGSLHKETNYGAIKKSIINKKGETEEKILYAVRKPLDALSASDIKNIVDERIREIVEEGKKKEGMLKKELEQAEKKLRDTEQQEEQQRLKHEIERIKEEIGKLFAIPNKDKSFTPIKKVRCFAKTVTNPISFEKKHRDISTKEYKQHAYFVNDGNYMMAIYEGEDKKGNIKRDFKLVNNMEAGHYFLGKLKENPIPDVHPKSGYPFKCLLKTGTMVILWQDSPKEVLEQENEKNKRERLYKVVGLSINSIKSGTKTYRFGNIVLRHSSEARAAIDLNTQDGKFKIDEEYVAQRKLSHIQFDALVEGYDFKLSPTGKLVWLNK